MQSLGDQAHFACPVCNEAVPVPTVVAGADTQIVCPICAETIAIDLEGLSALSGETECDCPVCGSSIAVPQRQPIERETAAAQSAILQVGASQSRLSNRNLIILGVTALLLLGGLGIFLATRKGPATRNTQRQVTVDVANNKFFQDLVASGATKTTDLQQITNIQPMGVTFLGLSREKLTWEQAQALAKKTGAHVLTIEPPGVAMRQPVLDAVATAYPELLGTDELGNGRRGATSDRWDGRESSDDARPQASGAFQLVSRAE